jgi:hypothetical protein
MTNHGHPERHCRHARRSEDPRRQHREGCIWKRRDRVPRHDPLHKLRLGSDGARELHLHRLLDHVHFLGGGHDDSIHAQVDGRDIRARVAELDVPYPPASAWSRQLCSGA